MGPHTSINALKNLLAEKGGPPSNYQYLMYVGKILQDGFTLSHYNIKSESNIFMNVSAGWRASGGSEVFQIFVKGFFHETPRTITLNGVGPRTTISDLKNLLAEKGGAPSNYQCLRYSTKILEDGLTLSHYNVKTDSTIFMSVRLLGC